MPIKQKTFLELANKSTNTNFNSLQYNQKYYFTQAYFDFETLIWKK